MSSFSLLSPVNFVGLKNTLKKGERGTETKERETDRQKREGEREKMRERREMNKCDFLMISSSFCIFTLESSDWKRGES